MPCVLIAGLFHETHTFLRQSTPRAHFSSALFDASGPTQLAGALGVAQEKNWTVVPGPYWLATPSGMADDAVLESWWAELEPLLFEIDGIYLDLHGAMACPSFPDAEGEILCRIRRVTQKPLAVALDLHGSITEAMCIPNAVFSAYRCNPHTDVKTTASRAARLLARILETGERPDTVRLQPPLLWPPSGTGTADEPMAVLEAQARSLETAHPELLDVSVFGGFSFSDIPETGVSFLATTIGDVSTARTLLEPLATTAVTLRDRALPQSFPLPTTLPLSSNGPLLLVEPAENVGGGAPGDGTHILRYFIENEVARSAVKLYDPATVAAFWNLPGGTKQPRGIGAHSGEHGIGEPVVAVWEKVSQSDGAYTLADPNAHNAMYGPIQQMGRCVVLRSESGVTVLVTSRPVMPMDLGPWRSVGLDPSTFSVIGVKAAVAHRRAYDPIASGSIRLNTPGPCDETLSRLPYENIRRPVWPLDEI